MPLTPTVFSPWQIIAMILAIAAGAALTRFLPFWLFPENRNVPGIVTYLGNALPPAMMGMLVVYCLKGADVVAAPHAVPELAAILSIVLIHTWRRNALLSIAGGTALYMVLAGMLGG